MKTVTLTVAQLQELMAHAAAESVFDSTITNYENEFPDMLQGQAGVRRLQYQKELTAKFEDLAGQVGLTQHDVQIIRFRTYEEGQEETALGIPGVCIAGPEDFEIEPDDCEWCVKVFGPVAERE